MALAMARPTHKKVADNALFEKPLQFLHIATLREYLEAEYDWSVRLLMSA